MSESWIQTGRGRNRVDGITFRGDGATVAMHLGSSETAGQLDGPPSRGSASFDSPTLLFRLLPGASEYRSGRAWPVGECEFVDSAVEREGHLIFLAHGRAGVSAHVEVFVPLQNERQGMFHVPRGNGWPSTF